MWEEVAQEIKTSTRISLSSLIRMIIIQNIDKKIDTVIQLQLRRKNKIYTGPISIYCNNEKQYDQGEKEIVCSRGNTCRKYVFGGRNKMLMNARQ